MKKLLKLHITSPSWWLSKRNPIPYVICHVVLSNDALRPSRLERHLTTAHPMLKGKPKEFFVAKNNSSSKMKIDHTGEFQQNNEKIVEASYHIAFMGAQQKKPHTFGETLIKPSILKAVEIVLGEESKRKIAQLSLSDNTVKRRIDVSLRRKRKISNSSYI
ncbi:SCAN domain-containing protein 3-like [Metopolophium dirhodum]|uniref:SCAN domain-containing protein 3-like n=1 Tax=Metopolophium dirhodum TaxID=44670 RepID=UPI00298FB198|nr:SCAN domain-containing protein 3-like [Metopolophium dirhodum]